MSLTCIVADDHPAILTAVGDALEKSGVEVVARSASGRDAEDRIEELHPAVAVLDSQMPDVRGTEVARHVARSTPDTAVVVYTAFGDRALLLEALDAGARGFVLKEAPLEELVRAVQVVAGGGSYVDPTLAGVLAGTSAEKVPTLTQREREVLRLLADGLSNEQIGKRLFISPETVRTHVRKAMDKLESDTRTQAVATALRRSLIA
jgi:DNA-binding NarL/FixJ family response regulator